MKERKETWVFTYRMPPVVGTHAVTPQFHNAAQAHAFADGLRRGGAIDVRYEMERSQTMSKRESKPAEPLRSREEAVSVFYSPQYVGSGYAFDTTRKAKWVADSLAVSPIAGLQLVEPVPLTRDQVTDVHDPSYLRSVETGEPRGLAESQGLRWDARLWPMVLASNGGVVAAARTALKEGVSGSLSSGLHHAEYASGAGYCTFNGLVIAAKAALASGAKSVLILDLGAHCGGGTASLIAGDLRIRQLDVSVSNYDSYGDSVQSRLVMVGTSSEYLPTLRRVLDEVDRQGASFDLCLYNAGMDLSEDCSTGGLSGITQDILAERERLVFKWCSARRLPIAFVLAGGYIGDQLDEKGLVALHRLTLSAAAQAKISFYRQTNQHDVGHEARRGS
jgi:acetoin utilization deacetylase AcuC-like enzyme